MIFAQRNQYYLESDCKRYTVSKTYGNNIRYLSWRRRDYDLPENLGAFDSEEEAIAACEAHAQKITQSAA